MVKSARIALVAAVPLSLLLAGHAEAAGGVNVATDGSAVARRVAESLAATDLGPAADVKVAAKAGVVTLTGWTATLAARERAARAVEGTAGVTFSYPVLAVRPTRAVADDGLLSTVQQALQGSTLSASVTAGTVRLAGSAPTAEALEAAQGAVKAVEGVKALVTDATVSAVTGPSADRITATPLVETSRLPPGTFHSADPRFTHGGLTCRAVARTSGVDRQTNVLAVEESAAASP